MIDHGLVPLLQVTQLLKRRSVDERDVRSTDLSDDRIHTQLA
jgi:hypothetical protein